MTWPCPGRSECKHMMTLRAEVWNWPSVPPPLTFHGQNETHRQVRISGAERSSSREDEKEWETKNLLNTNFICHAIGDKTLLSGSFEPGFGSGLDYLRATCFTPFVPGRERW